MVVRQERSLKNPQRWRSVTLAWITLVLLSGDLTKVTNVNKPVTAGHGWSRLVTAGHGWSRLVTAGIVAFLNNCPRFICRRAVRSSYISNANHVPQPESRAVSYAPVSPHLVGSRLQSPYHFPARIQSFQAVAAPFPGDSVLPSHSRARSQRRNASVQKSRSARRPPPGRRSAAKVDIEPSDCVS
jgi:hypothetical protein